MLNGHKSWLAKLELHTKLSRPLLARNSRARRWLKLEPRGNTTLALLSAIALSFPFFWMLYKFNSTLQGLCCTTLFTLLYLYATCLKDLVLRDLSLGEKDDSDINPVVINPDCFQAVTLPTLFAKATARDWIPDSGAMAHVTGQKEFFTEMGPPPPNTRIVGVGGTREVTGSGRVRIPIVVEGIKKDFVINNVLYAPGLPFNIISVKKLCLYPNGTDTDLEVSFRGSMCEITRRSTEALIALGDCVGGNLYKLRLQDVQPGEEAIYATTVLHETDLYTWHRRLEHLKESRLRRVLNNSLGITFQASSH
jgi:hypothetical protein